MDVQFTAVFRKVPEGFIGFVEELPGANTQGATLDEARANLQEAVAMILDANRELARQSAGTGPVIRECRDVCGQKSCRRIICVAAHIKRVAIQRLASTPDHGQPAR